MLYLCSTETEKIIYAAAAAAATTTRPTTTTTIKILIVTYYIPITLFLLVSSVSYACLSQLVSK